MGASIYWNPQGLFWPVMGQLTPLNDRRQTTALQG